MSVFLYLAIIMFARYSTHMEIRYIDIHSHLNLPQFDTDADDVVHEMASLGVAAITVGTNAQTSNRAIELANTHGNLFACVGLHPVDDPNSVVDAALLEAQLASKQVVAVGETGLDYFRLENDSDTKRQRNNFMRQIEHAVAHDKPLMLHIRPSAGTHDAYDDVVAILGDLKPVHGDRLRGNAHFFAGTVAQALQLNDLGFTVSFTGVITFARDYDAVIRAVPLAMMHAETDAPFVAPVPHRGERNVPQNVTYVYEKIAEIRGEDKEIVRLQLLANARRMFGLDS